MDLYNGEINEFVDWVTGENTFTKRNDTGGLPVSGASIRKLLLDKLRTPFYMFEDTANNKYRMFSSKEACDLWKENPSDNADLELFNFVRPSDYKLELTATEPGGFNNQYIRYGDSNNSAARIAFHWSIYNDEGDASDTMQATFTITNKISGASTTFTRWYNTSDADPNIQIYNYLQPGENSISIECRGTTTGARNTKSYNIILLQLNLTSTFKFYEKFTAGSIMLIPYTFERNDVSGTAKIHFQIDDGGSGKKATVDVVQDGPSKTTAIQQMLPTLSEGLHSLQIWVEGKYNDGNVSIMSNLLYYTFVVASSVVGSTSKFINICQSFTTGDFPLSNLLIKSTLYESQTMQWAYYTDSLQIGTQIQINWKLLQGLDDANPIDLATATANSLEKAPDLQYIPTIYTEEDVDTYLVGYYNNSPLVTIPVYIVKNNNITVNETGFYELKLSAYGKTNESSNRALWVDTVNNISTSFTHIDWNTVSGWNKNAFRTSGTNQYALINFEPFQNFSFESGKSIEIEFESEKVANDDDVLITIGSQGTNARIEITPNKATLYNNANTEVLHTNYKANERIKLCFIINNVPEDLSAMMPESGLAYIINNGILERSAPAQGSSFQTSGAIKIGGSASGVKVYNLRVYNYSITFSDAYNNYLYDSEDKAVIADRNNILDAGNNISFDLCKNKIDTILISGNLSNVLNKDADKDGSTTDVTIERFCPSDSSKNFKINNIQIRKHGQSTLNYPITSMKFWLGKSKSGTTPVYETTSQGDLLLNKNRYVMKSNTDKLKGLSIVAEGKPSVPANKYVLQANYADSSGVHNGALQRLIQVTWFNALIDGEYKLRTAPQLFSTNQLIHHNNSDIGEDGWIEGYGSRNGQNILWRDVSNSEFPYDIRISPDSFPCAVFYYDEGGSKTRTFLGQYVFMDDKKSDYSYGERSIYAVPTDPFCLTTTHKDDDSKSNRVWSNANVLRIEIVGSNVPFSSYMTSNGFTDIVEIRDEITNKVTRMYNWEQAFELVYPDDDDIAEDDAKAGMDKFNPNSKYVTKVQPFISFYNWVVSTRNNQTKFQQEAALHLDLYKMAAYYVFFLRFGLVDSVERNAQLKTYDGIHWHYEPWDMDIALGNKNDGGIAYDPPINRNTKLPGSITTYAYSGRSANESGQVVTSNWLWDALEAWPEWINNIVPTVADALYAAGLTYDNITAMFDNDYAAKWCEIMYNESGYFKYVKSNGGDTSWLNWLQGSRMTHRHWWLSNSMDYYDAKWFCGDYKNHYIYIRANVTEGSQLNIRIIPTKDSYMSVTKDGVLQTTRPVSKTNIFDYSMSAGSNTKNPILVYGANFMEEIDLSDIALGLDGVALDGVYSDVLGSPLKKINVGTTLTKVSDDTYTTTVAVLGCQLQGSAKVFENLTSLNIRGQRNQTDTATSINGYDMSELQEVLAMGSGLTNFYSSQSGNKFTKLELPSDVYTFWMNNSSWEVLEFWDCNIGNNGDYITWTDNEGNVVTVARNIATLTLVSGVPTTVHEVSLLGTTGSTTNSIIFVKKWLDALVAAGADLSEYELKMDKINWSETTVGNSNLLTFEDLSHLAQLKNAGQNLKGYLVLKDVGTELTAQQLNMIKSWFGDTVFTKDSSGLVIDHKRDYIQINIGGAIDVDELGNVTITEGNNASLNATRFALAEDDAANYSWALSDPENPRNVTRVNGLKIVQAEDSIDGIAYITSTQSNVGHDYDVDVACILSGVVLNTMRIHVVGATYPQALKIAVTNRATAIPRIVPNGTCFYSTGMKADLFVDSDYEYTGIIDKITYRIQRQGSNNYAAYIDRGSALQLEDLMDDYITVEEGLEKGICVSTERALPDDLTFYDITADCLFRSGQHIYANAVVAVGNDTDPIVSSIQSELYTVIDATWTTEFGSSINRNNIYKIDLYVLTGTLNFSSKASTLVSFATLDGAYLFKYLHSIQGIILDGCNLLENTASGILGDDKRQILFDRTPNLEVLSIQNCTGLTGTIDLSACPEITEVDASGTTVNITLPLNPKITKYEVGIPTSISIENPTVLQPSGVLVDGYGNLDSLIIKNIPNTKSYATFEKIMDMFILGGFIVPKTGLYNGLETSDPNRNTTSYISVTPGTSITLSKNVTGYSMDICFYANDFSYLNHQYWWNSSQTATITLPNNCRYIRLANVNTAHELTISYTSSGDVIFKYVPA